MIRYRDRQFWLANSVRVRLREYLRLQLYAEAYRMIGYELWHKERRRARWFLYAAEINGNARTFIARFVREYTRFTSQVCGRTIRFQEASNRLARKVLLKCLLEGAPSVEELVRIDTYGLLKEFNLGKVHYAANADVLNLLGTFEFYRLDIKQMIAVLFIAVRTILAILCRVDLQYGHKTF